MIKFMPPHFIHHHLKLLLKMEMLFISSTGHSGYPLNYHETLIGHLGAINHNMTILKLYQL